MFSHFTSTYIIPVFVVLVSHTFSNTFPQINSQEKTNFSKIISFTPLYLWPFDLFQALHGHQIQTTASRNKSLLSNNIQKSWIESPYIQRTTACEILRTRKKNLGTPVAGLCQHFLFFKSFFLNCLHLNPSSKMQIHKIPFFTTIDKN